MKLLAALFLALALAGLARASGLSGQWTSPMPNGELRMRVDMSGATFTAVIEVAGGSTIRLNGTAEGNRASGRAVSVDGVGTFEALMSAPQSLRLILSQADGPNQRAASVPLDFTRAGTADAAGGDPRLVGNWVHDNVIVSGGSSFASQEFLSIGADGSYALRRGQAAGGGANWSFSGGSDGSVERGRWRAQGGVLFVSDATGRWSRVGTYGMTDDGRTMRIVYDGGGRRLWSRR